MSNVILEGNSTRAERSARLNLDPGRGDWGDGGDGRSFVRGQSLQMIICKRPDPLDDHLQVACPPNDHLQETGSFDHLQVAGSSG